MSELDSDTKRQIEDAVSAAQREAATREKEKETAKSEPKPETRQVTAEEWIADVRKNVSTAAAEWCEKHREFVTDKKKNAKLQAAAYEAEHGEGIAPHSEDFIKFLETRLGIGGSEAEHGDDEQ